MTPARSIIRPHLFVSIALAFGCVVATGCSTTAGLGPAADSAAGWSQPAMAAASDATPAVSTAYEVEQTPEMTAAHTTLPLGATVRVTRLDTGRDVIVRITERVPAAISGQIIQLAKLPAEQLDLLADKLVPCRVDVLKISAPRTIAQ